MTLEAIQAALAASTPGPWVAMPGAQIRTIAKDVADDRVTGRNIAGSYRDIGDADAHLIANAPEWLQALVDVAVAAQKVPHVTAHMKGHPCAICPVDDRQAGAVSPNNPCPLRVVAHKLAALEQRSAP